MSTVGYKKHLVTGNSVTARSATKYLRLQYTTNGTDWVDADVIT